ncbi:MAG: hypothetical protein JO212_16985, partial [Acetobacteraceae bacterium]|nr:hypothetical protein [Acetobacteraceae bacterium]
MNPESLLLVGAVAGVGLLHTIVPDHWVPITLIARQRGWSNTETARASFLAGVGHVLSTLAIGFLIWIAGVAFATRFGNIVDAVASGALVAFGGWIMISALGEMRGGEAHGHSYGHSHGRSHDFSHLGGHDHATRTGGMHGPELQRIKTGHGLLELSIFEDGVPPRFRLTGTGADFVRVETVREGGAHQSFAMTNRG